MLKLFSQARFFHKVYDHAPRHWQTIAALEKQYRYTDAAIIAYSALKEQPQEERLYDKLFELLEKIGRANYRHLIVDEVLELHRKNFPQAKPKP